jgi:hypothetical protein
MARRDSNPDPLDVHTSSTRSTTLDTPETYGTPSLAGTTGSLGSSGYPSATPTPTSWQRAGEETQEGVRGAASQVKEQAKGLASEAKQEVAGLAGQAREHVQGLVDERKGRAAEQLGSFAGSLRDAARKLDDGDGGATALGRYAQTAADQVDRVSQYLRDRDLNSFVRDAETFARRHPDVFLGGTFIAGLVLARFFKASDRRENAGFDEGWKGQGAYTQPSTSYGSAERGTYGNAYGTTYGNTYNTGTGSTYEGNRSEAAGTPGGPVTPVGG